VTSDAEAIEGAVNAIEDFAEEVAQREIAHVAGDFSERPHLDKARDALTAALRVLIGVEPV
jgi:hypothetical protein